MLSDNGPMYITKRNGTKQPVLFDKITKRIDKLIQKDERDKIFSTIITQKVINEIYSGISTEEIDIEAAKICANMVTTHPLYGNLAGRILTSNLHKKTKNSFVDKMNTINEMNPELLDQEWLKWINNNSVELEKIIDYSRDYNYDYFGFKTLERSYLIKNVITKEIHERPQDMLLRVASFINMGNFDMIKKTYDFMSQGYYTHATPTLFNSGTKRPQLSSCFLLNTNDSLDGITTTWDRVAQISKWAGGIGLHVSNIRANGSLIKGTNGTSSGIIPMLQVYNNIARYIDQAGKRKGSFAIYLEPHHPDILEFLELKKNTGSDELRARDLFYALWVSDLFMEQVEKDGDWYLFCPNEAPRLNDVYGEEYKELYWKYVEEKRYKKQMKARKLMEHIMDSQLETGMPYMSYKDHVNRKSNQKNIGVIKSSNLCVSGDTYLYTKELKQNYDFYKIQELVNREIEVWNGEEWSKTIVRKTGENQRMRKIYFQIGEAYYDGTIVGTSIKCTDYHKFYIVDKNGKEKEVRAHELKTDDILYPWHDDSGKIKPYIVCANELTDEYCDTYCVNEPKRHRAVFNGILTGNCNEIVEVSNDEEHAVCNLASIAINSALDNFKSHRTWTIYTKQDCKYCKWAKTFMTNKGFKFIEKEEFDDDINKILEKEKKKNPEFKTTYPQILYGKQYIGGFDDMIKYTADSYNYEKLWEIAYVATKNLDKVIDKNFYPTKETRCSNMRNRPIGLGIQGMADTLARMKISFDSDEAVHFNKRMMETIYHASLSASCDIAKERSELLNQIDVKTGINYIPQYYDKTFIVQGLTQINDIPLSKDSLENRIYHELKLCSDELKQITSGDCIGAYSKYNGSPMSQGFMQFDMWEEKPLMDWNELRENIKKYGVRNSLVTALMPTASSSQILGNNECFEWFTNNVYTRNTLAGDFVVINKHLVNDLISINSWNNDIKQMMIASEGSIKMIKDIPSIYKNIYKTIWEIKQIWVLKNARARAPFVDQTQSMNIFMGVPDYKKLNSCHFWAWKNGLKTGMYYLRTRAAKSAIKFTVDPKLLNQMNNEEECFSCSA
jgi:ribonucleotide reductase alpha subunit